MKALRIKLTVDIRKGEDEINKMNIIKHKQLILIDLSTMKTSKLIIV